MDGGREGYELQEAADGRAAIEVGEKTRPEVALVDIGLPEADGYDVVRALRRLFDGAIVLIALTGYGQREDRDRALAEGFDEHVLKPVTRERLASVVAASATRLRRRILLATLYRGRGENHGAADIVSAC